MARRRREGPVHRIAGYPRGGKLTDWNGNVIGTIVSKRCARVRPGERGSWISNERCSYIASIDGRRYVGRGRGDGINVLFRQKKGEGGLGGARRKRRR